MLGRGEGRGCDGDGWFLFGSRTWEGVGVGCFGGRERIYLGMGMVVGAGKKTLKIQLLLAQGRNRTQTV